MNPISYRYFASLAMRFSYFLNENQETDPACKVGRAALSTDIFKTDSLC